MFLHFAIGSTCTNLLHLCNIFLQDTSPDRRGSAISHQLHTKRWLIAGLGGILVLAGMCGLWLVWPDPRLLYTVEVSSPLFHVAVSPDGQLLATSAFNGDVQLWNAADGMPVRTIQGH